MASKTENSAPSGVADAVNAFKSFVTGMLAAQVAAVFTNPIDVVKIRLQVQGEAAVTTASSNGAGQGRIGFLGQFVHG